MRPADLRGRRLALRLSQAELGRALGVARNTVARWVRGKLEIRYANLVALAMGRLEAEAFGTQAPCIQRALNPATYQPSLAVSSDATRTLQSSVAS